MQVKLAYDKTHITVNVPDKNLIKTFQTRKTKPLSHPDQVLKEKLKDPIPRQAQVGSPGLPELASKSKSVCIVVSDKTRPVPNKLILPVILDILESAGIIKDNITILIANGIHNPLEGKELIDFLGKNIVNNYKVVNHFAKDDNVHSFSGNTKSGTPVYINNNYLKSDLKILTGFIEPHFMTGFSGGRKSVCPGISSLKTVKVHHSPKFLESTFSGPGILEKNPCHEEALEIAKMAGVDFIINVTLDSDKNITGIFAGDLEKAHLEGVKFCRKTVTDYIDREVDVVVTSAGGYPLDCNFYQTVKGLVGALEVVKKGVPPFKKGCGTIIIASGCGDGIGGDEFRKLLFEMEDTESFIKMISQDNYFCVDQWEVEELVKVLRKVKVKMYSGNLTREEIKKCHAEPINSIEEGIDESIKEYGKEAKIAVIPDGPYVLACARQGTKKGI